jgi:Zn-dependent peptidase ImmA (M78 family)
MQQLKVPWLTKKSIAAAAAGVLTDYEAKIKRRVQPPIPVEKIIERGLSLRLGFIDLRKKLKLDDVLGATYVREGVICVDQSLAENQNEGRLSFTFAHETGHWVLHRKLVDQACRTGGGGGFIRLRRNKVKSTGLNEFESDIGQTSRSDGCGAISPNTFQQSEGGFIFCRIRDAKKPIEWQADYFASCMLMPETAVKDAFYTCYGAKPLILYNVKSAFCGPLCFDPCVETWPQIAGLIKEAGGFFNVSKQAMIIRLQDLGLVKNETQARLSWSESYVMA